MDLFIKALCRHCFIYWKVSYIFFIFLNLIQQCCTAFPMPNISTTSDCGVPRPFARLLPCLLQQILHFLECRVPWDAIQIGHQLTRLQLTIPVASTLWKNLHRSLLKIPAIFLNLLISNPLSWSAIMILSALGSLQPV